MTFLPIASRELRVAARKRSTFWLRVIAAVIGMMIGGGFMLMSTFQPTGLPSMGRALFGSLTWISVIAALATGIFFTADCLSEEKREGTLGFLFLTDLRGYDVVLGKLSATSLRGWFALLALFPVLAVTLLMGGVTGVQFWKATLALANALFFSLATGLFVSSLGRDSQRVMAATLFLLIILAGGGPICDAVIAGVKHRGFIPVWSVTSPAFAFSQANAWGRSPFWRALVLSHLIAWALLALACGLVPKTWQERGRKSTGSMRGWAYAFKYGPAKQRGRLRRKLLERHPVMWLASRERWQAVAIWIIALLVSGMAGYAVFGAPREVWFVWNLMGTLFTTLIYFWAASQSCRFFVE